MPIPSTARATLARIDALAAGLESPRQRTMLRAFRDHWAGEVTADLDAAMAVLPDDSFFIVRGAVFAGTRFEVRSASEHRAVYQAMLDLGLNPGGAFSDERFGFGDRELFMEATYSNVVPGSMLVNAGAFDPDRLYLFHANMVMICVFDDTPSMLGKRDYLDLPYHVEPADQDTIHTLIGL